MRNKCLIVVLALVVALVPLFAHENSVDLDTILISESLHVFLVLTHDYFVTTQVFFVSLQVLYDFIDYSLVLRVQRLHELLSFLLALNETLCLVQQINVHHIEVIKVIQVIIEHNM